MPFLVLLLVTAACAPVAWPAPPFGFGPGGSAGLTAAAVAFPLAVAWVVRTRAVRGAADRARLGEAARRYVRARRVLVFLNLGVTVLAVVGLGWGWTVQHALRVPWGEGEVLAPLAELVVPLPYLAIVVGAWLIYFDAERALHRGPRFWTRAGYVVHQARQLALFLGVSAGAFAAFQSAARFAPETAADERFRLAAVATVPAFMVLAPLLVRPLLGLRPLPPGPARDRLDALARRLNFRSAGLLVWPTHGAGVNALILGVVPRARYVVLTDGLVDGLPADERDAVFGHEVGHARHGHIPYYAVFLLLSLAVLAAGLLWALQWLSAAAEADPGAWWAGLLPTEADGWAMFLPVGLTAAYLFVVFGFLSRRCERQADVFGCRAVSCGDPRCAGHDEGTVYPAGGAAVSCPTGVRTFARALERVAVLNGWEAPAGQGFLTRLAGWMRAWQHGPIPARVDYLLSLIGRPDRERRFGRRLLLLRVGLVAGLAGLLVVLGRAVGWSELLAAL